MKTIKNMFFTLRYTFKLLLNYAKARVILIIILTIISALIPFASLYNTQAIINSLQNGDSSFISLIYMCLAFVAIGFISEINNDILAYKNAELKEYLYLILNKDFINKTKSFKFKDFENSETYNLMQRAEDEIGVRPFKIFGEFLTILNSIVTLFSSFTILFFWHKWTIIGFLILPILSAKYFKSINQAEFEMMFNRTKYERKSWYISNLLLKDIYIKEIKVLHLFDYLFNIFKDLRNKFYKENKGLLIRRIKFTFLYGICTNLYNDFLAIFCIYETFISKILVGNMMTYINTVNKVNVNVNSIVSNLFTLYQDCLYMENLIVFDTKVNSKIEIEKKENISNIERITINNLKYKYQNRISNALEDLNLVLNKGESIVLVGENGCGKSTLIKIICGLYDDYIGDILIDGIDLNKIDKQCYHKRLSVVFQDYNNYQLTIKENIGFGDIDYLNDYDKIHNASKISGAYDFINQLDRKFDQQVGNWFEGGTQLSGGQWQKLALSRSFMKKSDMYIFDEPTASLDPKSEFEFFKNVAKECKNSINIFVTHRFVNASFADRILVMKDGRIIENGTHEQLISKKGYYYTLYTMQMGTYKE